MLGLLQLRSTHGLRIGLPVTFLALGACTEVMDEALFIVDAEPVEQVHVLAKDATVELVGGRQEDEIRVVATRTYSDARPRITVQTLEGQLLVSHRCPRQRVCDVHYLILMPREIDAEVLSDGGSVQATQLWGNLGISTVWGDVFGSALRSADVDVTTELGDVTLAFDGSPDRVRVSNIEGHTTISVPDDQEYLLELETQRGEAAVVDLTRDSDAERSIEVVSEGGDITVRGTPPVTEEEDLQEEENDEDEETAPWRDPEDRS
jgi:hypothetical protein